MTIMRKVWPWSHARMGMTTADVWRCRWRSLRQLFCATKITFRADPGNMASVHWAKWRDRDGRPQSRSTLGRAARSVGVGT